MTPEEKIDRWYFDSDNHWHYSMFKRIALWFWAEEIS